MSPVRPPKRAQERPAASSPANTETTSAGVLAGGLPGMGMRAPKRKPGRSQERPGLDLPEADLCQPLAMYWAPLTVITAPVVKAATSEAR